MEDQTNFLLAQRISTGSTGEDKAVNARIENGECCVVFTSPVTYLCWEMGLSKKFSHLGVEGTIPTP